MSVDTSTAYEQLKTQLEARNAQLHAVREITAALSSKTDLDEILRSTLTCCLSAVRALAGSLLLFVEEEGQLQFKYVVGEAAAVLTGQWLDPQQGIAGEVYRTGEPKITEDVTQDKSHYRGIDASTGFQTRNMVTVPIKSINGDPVGVMQILNKEGTGFFDAADIDTLMILSAQAASAIENARLFQEAQLAVVVKLMGDISHDVKNMVTPVTVCAQTLEFMFEDQYASLETLKAKLSAEQVQELDEATEGLRDFYPEAVRMFLDGSEQVQARVREIADCVKGIVAEPTFTPEAINDLVRAVAKPLALVADRAELTLDLDGLSDDLPLVPLDPKQMYNCVYNLINNAIPETPAGGKIMVRTYLGNDPEFRGGEQVLMIQVADTGRGMPEHVRAKLFTKDAVSTKPGGTGLGTKIVGNVVEAHEGKITVDSVAGEGTTFTIRIPLERTAT
ncbi:MAG TPA: hypothetical protein DCZ72_13830 [Armatimonadetes bacterium]|nr:hypothetical protein [Armatimonadota bacterium]